jgi:hypothetical protein
MTSYLYYFFFIKLLIIISLLFNMTKNILNYYLNKLENISNYLKDQGVKNYDVTSQSHEVYR